MNLRSQSAQNPRKALQSAQVSRKNLQEIAHKQQEKKANNWVQDNENNNDSDDDGGSTAIFDGESRIAQHKKKNLHRQIRSAQTVLRPGTAVSSASSGLKLNVKTLKSITNSQSMEVTPKEIIFENIEANQAYQTILYVQNLSKTPKRIRVYQPKTKKFWVEYDSSQSLAAGMHGKLYIHFESNVIEDLSDEIVIEYEEEGQKYKVFVPLYSRRPQAKIACDPFVDLGFVRVRKDVWRVLTFQNNGIISGKVRILSDSLKGVKFDPSVFVMQPGQITQVKMLFNHKESGIYRGSAEIQVEGVQKLERIDINATVVEYNKMILDENNSQTTNFDFGEVYFGQSKHLNGFLFNNSPKSQKFKIVMKLGHFNPSDDALTLQTPADQGKEIIDQIMSVTPSIGEIKPYSNISLRFNCNSVASYEQQVLTRKYALGQGEAKPFPQDFYYSAVFKFVDEDLREDPLCVLLQMKGYYPQVKINKSLLQFGECNVNDHRESIIDIENKHQKLPLEVVLERTPSFSTDPLQLNLLANQRSTIKVSFVPQTVGVFSKDLVLSLLNGVYKIPIKLHGTCQKFQEKKKKDRGPECGVEEFLTNDQFLDATINKDIFNKKVGAGKQTFGLSTQVKLPKGLQDEKDIDPVKLAELQKEKLNKQKYDAINTESRKSRIQKEKQKILDLRFSQMKEKMKDSGGAFEQTEEEKTTGPVDDIEKIVRGDPKKGAPIDLQFEWGMVESQVMPPELDLPMQKDPLFVLKPIGNYEPVVEEIQRIFHCDPEAPIKKLWPERAVDPKEIQMTSKELTGKELRSVQAGPTMIDYGEVYVCSRVQKTFSVKNDLRDTIKVQLKTNASELKESYQKPQILKSGQVARFSIVLYSEDVDEEFKARVQYVINSCHTYEFEVTAKIIQVHLKLNKTLVKFSFLESSILMDTTEVLLIENDGNAPGQFKWDVSSKIFQVDPIEGFCPPKGNFPVTITYKPSPGTSNRDSGIRYEEEKLLLQVINGMSQIVKCVGQVNEAKCILKAANIDFKQVLVCKEVEKSFIVKNSSRIGAIYKILSEYMPDHITVTSQLTGKIPSDGQIEVGVKFFSENESKVESDIRIMIRGGKILRLPVLAESIIPNVFVKEPNFDFGKITALGNQAERQLTLLNESLIDAELVLDLRGEQDNSDAPEGIECLSVVCTDKLADENTFHEVHIDQLDDNVDKRAQKDKDGDDQSMMSDGEDNGGKHSDSSRLYHILLKPSQSLKLKLIFQPKEIKLYKFKLPLILARYGKLSSLTRDIQCRGLKPKFIVDPQILEFPRKIISSIEHQFPTNSEVFQFKEKKTNPEKRSMSWRIDVSGLEKDKIFSIHPTQGKVDSGQTLRIKANFNPSYPNSYEKQVPLFVDDPDLPPDQPCCFITLKGVSAFPKLLFDRREILLPVVPLNIESRSIFWLINDGYDTLKIKHKVLEELGQIDLRCNFPDGVDVDATNTKIKVEVIFSSKNTTSFTTKIEFKDNSSNSYPIVVSGTADNSILTNFPFMQRNKGGYIFKSENDKSPVQICEEKEGDLEDDISVDAPPSLGKNQSLTKRNSLLSSQTLTSLTTQGQMPIPKDMLESSREFIRQWLNYFVVTSPIQSFPESIVEGNGEQLFELILFCSGKSYSSFQSDIPVGTKRGEKVNLLFKQYNEVIKGLKSEGALLNHIRPQYLLGYSDYHVYIKSLPKEQNEHVSPLYLKMHPKLFQYIHLDCWISLFYQIIKIYQLPRVNLKLVKTIPNCISEKLSIPNLYTSGSNVFTDKEGILIRWLEINCDIISGSPLSGVPPKRIKNFEGDLRDGTVISNLIQNYVGGNALSLLSRIKSDCVSDEDYYSNCENLSNALKELKIQTQFNVVDLSRPSAREVLLFILQLSNTIPFYIPKQAPIIFQCVLGEEITKTIEIFNPTQKAISYSVSYEGSQDFLLESETLFKVEPKATFKYKIRFCSRVSNLQTGRITFTNKKESTAIAQALVFDLKSQITGRVSIQVWNIDCPLYEIKEFALAIQNKFTNSEYGDFTVQIIHEYEIKKPAEKKEEDPKDKKKKPEKKKKKAKKEGEEEEEELQLPPFEKLNLPCFFSKTDRVKLKRGATFNLQMAFIPLLYENQKCFVIFNDPKVGEFQHEIKGRVDMPEQIIEIPNDKNAGSPIMVEAANLWNIPLTFKNPQILEAKKYLEQWLVEKPKLVRNAQQTQTITSTINQPQTPLTVKQIYNMILSPDFLGYNIEIEQPTAGGIIVPRIMRLTNPNYKPPVEEDENGKKKKTSQIVDLKDQKSPNKTVQDKTNKKDKDNSKSKDTNTKDTKDEDITKSKSKLLSKVTNTNTKDKSKEDNITDQNNNKNSKQKLNMDLIHSQSMNSNGSNSNNQATFISNSSPEPETNMIPISFFFKNPFKDYTANIILKNQQLTDVRRLRVVVSVIPKQIKAVLEMTAPARELVMQEIPIINNTDKDWQLKINLTLSNIEQKSFFVNQPPKLGQERPNSIREYIVKKRTTANLPICFFPEWMCQVEAKLNIFNPLTQDQFDYDLKGIGEEPLAMDHIVITSQSRVTTVKEILISNPTDKIVTYTVETDLIGAAGQSAISIPAKKSATYLLQVHPVMSGQYTGSITFTKADGTYIWWTALLDIESPPSDRVVDLITSIRKALAFDIELANPTNDTIVFEVAFEGEGLLGDQYLQVPALKTVKYELFYMPLKAGKFKGSIAFLSEKLGEIWYELNMQADDSSVVRLPVLKCELGKTDQHEITLENPSNEDVKVRATISNPTNFEIYPENIVIPAYEQVQVNILYRPSSLDKQQTAEIIFETETVGKWVFAMYGQGLPPTNFETKVITTGQNKDFSGLILFKNPFKDPIQVRIFLDTQDTKVLDVIKLAKRPRDYTIIPPLTTYEIPFSFQPKEIRYYDCDVVVSMNEKIQWRFPIHAMTESLNSGIIRTFKTKCRVVQDSSFTLNLPGIQDMFDIDDSYTFQIQEIPEEFKKIVNRSLKIKMNKNKLDSPHDSLSFNVTFKPYKPLKCQIDFVVLRQSGGSWRFKIMLEATPPNEDDVIILSTSINHSDSVSFKLTNRFKNFATFYSHFTEGTDSEFSVTPQTGLLEPAGGRNGTTFTITFSPREYGKVRQGKLVIETDDMYWSYILKGVLPHYSPPQIEESRYNYKPNLSYIEEHDKRLQEKKNFITTNIKNQSVILKESKSVKMSKNPSTFKGYFNYVPSLAGGEDIISGVSFLSPNSQNNAQRLFRVNTARSVKSGQKDIKGSQLAQSLYKEDLVVQFKVKTEENKQLKDNLKLSGTVGEVGVSESRKLQLVKEEVEKLKAENEKLYEKQNENEIALQSVNNELKKLQEQKKDLEKYKSEKLQLGEKIKKMQEENEEKSSSSMESAQKREQELSMMQFKLAQYEKAKGIGGNSLYGSINEMVRELNGVLEELKKKFVLTKKQIEINEKYAQMEREVSKLRLERESLEADLRAQIIDESEEKIDALNSQCKQSIQQVKDEYEAKLNNLQKKYEQSQEEQSKKSQKVLENDSLKTQLVLTEATIKDLRSEQVESNKVKQSLEKQVKDQKDEISDLQQQINSYKSKK